MRRWVCVCVFTVEFGPCVYFNNTHSLSHIKHVSYKMHNNSGDGEFSKALSVQRIFLWFWFKAALHFISLFLFFCPFTFFVRCMSPRTKKMRFFAHLMHTQYINLSRMRYYALDFFPFFFHCHVVVAVVLWIFIFVAGFFLPKLMALKWNMPLFYVMFIWLTVC